MTSIFDSDSFGRGRSYFGFGLFRDHERHSDKFAGHKANSLVLGHSDQVDKRFGTAQFTQSDICVGARACGSKYAQESRTKLCSVRATREVELLVVVHSQSFESKDYCVFSEL